MSNIYFVFGPNGSFFFDGPKCYDSIGMPAKLWEVIGKDPNDRIRKVKSLAMSDYGDGELFFVYESISGTNWHWSNNALKECSPNLHSSLVENGPHNCRVAFGENGHFVAWKENGTWFRKTNNLLDSVISGVKIDVAALGVDDSYFIVAKNGKMWWHLKGHYPALQAVTDGLQAGDVLFVALNPFRVGEFFILFANNTAMFQVPLSYRSKLEENLAKHGITCRALTSQQTDRMAKVPASAQSSEFAKGLLKSVVGNVSGGIISGVASALVGAVSCTVM